MKKGILATKLGMTQIWNDKGEIIPVTVLNAGPCTVLQIKTKDTDGYDAIQVGFGDIREKLLNKPQQKKKKKSNSAPKRYIREFRFEDVSSYSLGQEIKADIFQDGDIVDASGISKGKGFQGAIKRLGQHRGPMKHGSKFHRHQGSNNSATTPGRVYKGKGMPGHMGVQKITTQNLEIVKVDLEKNLILIKGSVPGPNKSLVTLTESVKGGK